MFATASRVSFRRSVHSARLQQTSFLQRNFQPQSLTPKLHSMNLFRSRVSTTASVKTGSDLAQFPEYFNKVKASNGREVSLSSFKGRKPVVLFFYPRAGTPGCTKQVSLTLSGMVQCDPGPKIQR